MAKLTMSTHEMMILSNGIEITAKLLSQYSEEKVKKSLITIVGCDNDQSQNLINLAKDYMSKADMLTYDEMENESKLNSFESENC